MQVSASVNAIVTLILEKKQSTLRREEVERIEGMGRRLKERMENPLPSRERPSNRRKSVIWNVVNFVEGGQGRRRVEAMGDWWHFLKTWCGSAASARDELAE